MAVLPHKTFIEERVTEKGIGIKVIRNIANASKTTKSGNSILEVLMKLQGRAMLPFWSCYKLSLLFLELLRNRSCIYILLRLKIACKYNSASNNANIGCIFIEYQS